MGEIALEGMKFFAYHGYYKEEQTLGNHFLVDVYVETSFQQQSGDGPSIDYTTIYLIVKFEMEKASKLLENVSERIINSIRAKFSNVETLVKLRKCNPSLGGRVQYSYVESTGKIGLEGMEFFAPIGIYEEDQLLANEFIVDVYVNIDVGKASQSDNLNDTLNYEALFWAAKTEMENGGNLLEEVALSIVENLKYKHNNIFQIEVNVRRKYPPVAGQIPQAAVQVQYDHMQECSRCQRDILCYDDENCWCHDFKVLPITQRILDKLYRGCLCKSCLRSYAVKVK